MNTPYNPDTFATPCSSFDALFHLLKGRESRKLGHETYLEKHPEGLVGIRYHWTTVVLLTPDGVMTLNTGGWRTPTTKKRINEYLPFGYRVFQKDYKWFLSLPSGEFAPFEDGMKIICK
jgi:hypothetical protein